MIGRTPVFSPRLKTYGYDLHLCAGGGRHEPSLEVGSQQPWLEAARGIAIDQLVGPHAAFIPVSPRDLDVYTHLDWPKDRLIGCLDSTVLRDPEILSGLRRMQAAGFRLTVINPPLALLNDVPDTFCSVRIDASSAMLQPTIPTDALHQRGLRLIAQAVENLEQYDTLRQRGFDLFAGPAFERPKWVQGTEIPANRLNLISLLGQLQRPDTDLGTVEAIIARDVSLSYKLIKLINSAFFGMPRRVDSIRRAVLFFGLQRLKNWITVILMSAIDYRPRELLLTAAIRARMCELLAHSLGRERLEGYYLAGLFSVLDAIIDAPMDRILDTLHLEQEIHQALCKGTGPIGEVLRAVLAFEQGRCSEVVGLDFPTGGPIRAYTEAIAWATATFREIGGS